MTRFHPSHVLTILVIALSLSTPIRAPAQATTLAEWGWPLAGQPRVIRHFDPHTTFGPGHRGIDLRTQEGAPVLAPTSGIVTFAGLVAGRHVLTVMHPGSRIRVTVEPVHALVAAGDLVRRGDVVGVVRSGRSGPHCSFTCLHLGMRIEEQYLNPLRILRTAILKQLGTRVRLIEGRPQALHGDMGVSLGGGEVGVPQHFLNSPKVSPAFENVGGRRVAHSVRCNFGHSRC